MGLNIAPIYVPQGDTEALYPAWSPDGSRIAFSVGPAGDNMRIVVANADRSDLEMLMTTPICRETTQYANDLNPSWSRDGRYIALQRQWQGCPPGLQAHRPSTSLIVRADRIYTRTGHARRIQLRPDVLATASLSGKRGHRESNQRIAGLQHVTRSRTDGHSATPWHLPSWSITQQHVYHVDPAASLRSERGNRINASRTTRW